MRYFFLSLFISVHPLLLLASEENISTTLEKSLSTNNIELFSQCAGYDGQELKLGGEIHLSHPLGKLSSKNASLKKSLRSSDNKIFSSIQLENKVKLELERGGVLYGEKALYDVENHNLEFTKLKNRIKYKDKIKQKNGTFLPYSIFANKASSIADDYLKKENLLFKFSDNVNIKFEKGISIRGHEALFQDEKISLSPKNEKSHCIVKSKSLKIYSSTLDLNIKDQLITLKKTHGILFDSIKFSADSLIYSDPLKKLTLDSNAHLKDKKLDLSCQYIDIFLSNEKIDKIISSYNAEITLKNERHSKITSTSPIIFDFEKREISSDEMDDKSSICYEDDSLLILAKKGSLFLSTIKSSYNIESATLEKEIYFVSTDNKGSPTYGVAEKLTFIPEKNLFVLEGSPGKKVLFCRGDNTLTISADKIEICHTKNITEDTIKGFGTVRFTLNLSEQFKIQETITKYKQRYDIPK